MRMGYLHVTSWNQIVTHQLQGPALTSMFSGLYTRIAGGGGYWAILTHGYS